MAQVHTRIRHKKCNSNNNNDKSTRQCGTPEQHQQICNGLPAISSLFIIANFSLFVVVAVALLLLRGIRCFCCCSCCCCMTFACFDYALIGIGCAANKCRHGHVAPVVVVAFIFVWFALLVILLFVISVVVAASVDCRSICRLSGGS